MLLAKIPRRRYLDHPTPLEKLEHLTKELGGPKIYMKRDDLLPLTSGGNKTRKLEFLIGDALKHEADTIITTGALQSNHCRLTLAAAIKEGLKCHLVLQERQSGTYDQKASGNNFLYELLKPEDMTILPPDMNALEEMNRIAVKLRDKGRNPYVIPLGGSNEIGSLGYVACAQEIIQQADALDVKMDHIVLAVGSGGTFSGLALGFGINYSDVSLTGIHITGTKETQDPLVKRQIENTANFLQIPFDIPIDRLFFYDQYVGEGYAMPTEAMIEAVKLVARTEGILLDPVYTGKAMAGLIDLIRKGIFTKDEHVLFIHTGGSPALFHQKDLFL